MSPRLLCIPLLCLVLVHAVLGAGRGESVICFGGHHHHHHHDSHPGDGLPGPAAFHHGTAGHPCSLPGAIPVAYLSDCCTCPVVLLDLHELHPPDREPAVAPASPAGPCTAATVITAIGPRPPDQGRPPRPPVLDPDPARRHHLAVLGVTRLLT